MKRGCWFLCNCRACIHQLLHFFFFFSPFTVLTVTTLSVFNPALVSVEPKGNKKQFWPLLIQLAFFLHQPAVCVSVVGSPVGAPNKGETNISNVTLLIFSPLSLFVFLQYWHKRCFSCEVCKMTLNMKNYKGFEKRPYCNA